MLKNLLFFSLVFLSACKNGNSTEILAGIKLGEPLDKTLFAKNFSAPGDGFYYYHFSNDIIGQTYYHILHTQDKKLADIYVNLGYFSTYGRNFVNIITPYQFNYFYNVLVEKYGKENNSWYGIESAANLHQYSWRLKKIHISLEYDTTAHISQIYYSLQSEYEKELLQDEAKNTDKL